MQHERKAEYSSGAVHLEFEKWKAERSILEKEIQSLREESYSSLKNNKELSNIQEELVTYKVERENMAK